MYIGLVSSGYDLFMLCLQSERYTKDAEFRQVVDRFIAEWKAIKEAENIDYSAMIGG